MFFEYEKEIAEYPTCKLHNLKDGETVDIDFNGKYKIEFEKAEPGVLKATGRGVDGYGRPIKVDSIEVAIEPMHGAESDDEII